MGHKHRWTVCRNTPCEGGCNWRRTRARRTGSSACLNPLRARMGCNLVAYFDTDAMAWRSQSSPGEDGLRHNILSSPRRLDAASQSSPGEDGLQLPMALTKPSSTPRLNPLRARMGCNRHREQRHAGDQRVSILSGRGRVATREVHNGIHRPKFVSILSGRGWVATFGSKILRREMTQWSQSSPGEDGLQQGGNVAMVFNTKSQSSPGEDGLQPTASQVHAPLPSSSQSSPGEDGLQLS